MSTDITYNSWIGQKLAPSYTMTATNIAQVQSLSELQSYVGTAAYYLDSETDTLYTRVNYEPASAPFFTFNITADVVTDTGGIISATVFTTQFVYVTILPCTVTSVMAVTPESQLYSYILDSHIA